MCPWLMGDWQDWRGNPGRWLRFAAWPWSNTPASTAIQPKVLQSDVVAEQVSVCLLGCFGSGGNWVKYIQHHKMTHTLIYTHHSKLNKHHMHHHGTQTPSITVLCLVSLSLSTHSHPHMCKRKLASSESTSCIKRRVISQDLALTPHLYADSLKEKNICKQC